MSYGEVRGVQDRSKRAKIRERLVLRNEKYLKIYGALRDYVVMKMYWQGPTDFAETPKL